MLCTDGTHTILSTDLGKDHVQLEEEEYPGLVTVIGSYIDYSSVVFRLSMYSGEHSYLSDVPC